MLYPRYRPAALPASGTSSWAPGLEARAFARLTGLGDGDPGDVQYLATEEGRGRGPCRSPPGKGSPCRPGSLPPVLQRDPDTVPHLFFVDPDVVDRHPVTDCVVHQVVAPCRAEGPTGISRSPTLTVNATPPRLESEAVAHTSLSGTPLRTRLRSGTPCGLHLVFEEPDDLVHPVQALQVLGVVMAFPH